MADSCSAGCHVVAFTRDPRAALLPQAGDADLEELIEVLAEDRQELDALGQRLLGVLGQRQDALVEVEPGQLAVEVTSVTSEVGGRDHLDAVRIGVGHQAAESISGACRWPSA
jgi:hypothetical protein